MGLKVGAKATIKEVTQREGTYTKGRIAISTKDPKRGKWYSSFVENVTFISKAHLQHPMVGQKIRIKDIDIHNGYLDKSGEQAFTRKIGIAICDYELEFDRKNEETPTYNYGEQTVNFEGISELTDDSLPF